MTFFNHNDWVGFRNLKINIESRSIYVEEKCIHMTRTEYKLLFFLISQRRRVYSIEEVILGTWGAIVVTNKTINTHLSHIRSKIKGVDFKLKINRNAQICINDL